MAAEPPHCDDYEGTIMLNRMTSRKTSRTLVSGAPLLAALSVGLTGALLTGSTAQAATLYTKTDAFLRPVLAQKAAQNWSSIIVKIDGALTDGQEANLRACGADITRHLPFIN
jgi:hypothetical protein